MWNFQVLTTGAQFTCFTSANVQMLTHRGAAAQWLAGGVGVAHTQFTCFTSTKEQILTLEELLRSGWEEEGEEGDESESQTTHEHLLRHAARKGAKLALLMRRIELEVAA